MSALLFLPAHASLGQRAVAPLPSPRGSRFPPRCVASLLAPRRVVSVASAFVCASSRRPFRCPSSPRVRLSREKKRSRRRPGGRSVAFKVKASVGKIKGRRFHRLRSFRARPFALALTASSSTARPLIRLRHCGAALPLRRRENTPPAL